MVNEKTMQIVKSTAPLLKEKGKKITKRMYEILFTKYPETKELFKNAPEDQYKRLANALIAYSSNIDNLSALGNAVEKMVQKHVETGVQPEHYPMVADALITAIREVLNPEEEVLNAWEEAYNFLAEILIEEERKAYSSLK